MKRSIVIFASGFAAVRWAAFSDTHGLHWPVFALGMLAISIACIAVARVVDREPEPPKTWRDQLADEIRSANELRHCFPALYVGDRVYDISTEETGPLPGPAFWAWADDALNGVNAADYLGAPAGTLIFLGVGVTPTNGRQVGGSVEFDEAKIRRVFAYRPGRPWNEDTSPDRGGALSADGCRDADGNPIHTYVDFDSCD